MEISKFYKNEYANAALYTSFRTICHVIDGQKVGARKILFTVDKKNIVHNYKVANLAADVSSFTEFIHGSASLEGAIVGMAQTFNNNYPLFDQEGSFGDRLNHSAAASRYIFTKKSVWFDKFFNDDDKKIIQYREFEGKSIEPFFYVPILPLVLLNGNSGIGNGYAQKILPRKMEDVKEAIIKILSGKKVKNISPWFNGFRGKINQLEDGRIEIMGTIINEGTTIQITEVPFNYDLSWYLDQLDTLVEKGIIKDFKDFSENGTFKFEIKCTREFGRLEEYDILDKLKLIDRQSENFTCVSVDDSIIEFKNEIEILEYYIKFRLDFYKKRKIFILSTLSDESLILRNKIRFIESIMDGNLVIFKKTKETVEKFLIENNYDKVDNSFEYLLEMRIDTFTKEKIDKLKNQLSIKKTDISELTVKTEQDLWKEDLNFIK